MPNLKIVLALLVASTAVASADPADVPVLMAKRLVQIQRLIEYRDTGAFTVDSRGFPASVFRDRDGHLCAMASLIDTSGRSDLVDEVARTNNKLRLADVHDGPLLDWMLDSGLTQEEVAMVQGALSLNEMRYLRNGNDFTFAANNNTINGVKIVKPSDEVKMKITQAVDQLAKKTAASVQLAADRKQAQKPATK